MKILHIADTHLSDANLKDIEPCTEEVVQVASLEKPDLILHGGDLFDSRMVRMDSDAGRYAINWVRRLAEVAPLIYCIGTPSHDGRAPDILESVRSSHEIWVSAAPEQLGVYRTDNGMELTWLDNGARNLAAIVSVLPAPTKQFWQSSAGIEQTDAEVAGAIGQILAGFGPGAATYDVPHILLGHWSVRGAAISETQMMVGREIEVARDHIALATADLVCLGHIHKAQQIGDRIFYAGSGHRANFGEMDEKGFFVHTIEGHNHSSEWYPVPSRKLIKEELNFLGDTLPSPLEPESWMVDTRGWDDGTHVQISIKVWQDDAAALDRDLIIDYFSEACGSVDLRVIRVPRETVRSQNLLTLKTLPDKIKELAALRKETINGGILAKAADLESVPQEQLMEAARARATHGHAASG